MTRQGIHRLRFRAALEMIRTFATLALLFTEGLYDFAIVPSHASSNGAVSFKIFQ